VAFGPHGPRAPTSAPGDGVKIFLGTAGLVGVAGVLFLILQHFGKPIKNFFLKKKDISIVFL
jgi:cytochrome c oxidase subunit 4